MGTVFQFTEPYDDFDPEAFAADVGFTVDFAASSFDQGTGDFTLALVETLTAEEQITVLSQLNDAAAASADGVSAARGTAGRYIALGVGAAYAAALFAGDNRLLVIGSGLTPRRVAGADPVDPEDFVTLGYLTGPGGGMTEANVAALRSLRVYR